MGDDDDQGTEPVPHEPFFVVALVTALLMLGALFLPFVGVLLAAMILVVVTWPLFEWLTTRTGPGFAAVLLTISVVAVLLTPVTVGAVVAFREGVEVGNALLAFTEAGGVDAWLLTVRGALPTTLATWLEQIEITAIIERVVQTSVSRGGTILTSAAQAIGQGAIQAVVFVVGLATLYMEGPALIATLRRATPLPFTVVDHLVSAFGQLAHNVVVGLLATSVGQGAVAALGFALVGMERVTLIGMATAVSCQIPVVGSAVIWVPLVLALLIQQRFAAAAFAAAWSLILTASVDNLLKPWIYRHTLRVHPTLVLFALLGGLWTLGPTGLLVGPTVLIGALTLWSLHDPGQRPLRTT